MKPDFNEFMNTAKKIRMTDAERLLVETALKKEIEKSPVRKATPVGHIWWSSVMNHYLSHNIQYMPIALLIAIFAGGGISYAAESALPGQSLYPVKVNINETIRGWASFSGEAKADWEARRAERRLEEAEKLAAESRLDANTRAIIETNFEEHTNRVEERIKEFESRDPEKVAQITANFETSLDAHARILESIGLGRGGDVEAEVRKLIVKIRVERDGAKTGKEEAEAKIRAETRADMEEAAVGRARAAKNKIEEVKKFIERVKIEIDADAAARASARMEAAEALYAQGQTQLEAKAFGEAFVFFQRAHNTAQEVKILLKAKQEFEDDDADDSRNRGSGSANTAASSSVDVKSGENRGRDGDEQEVEGTDVQSDAEIKVEGDLRLETKSGSGSGSGSEKRSIRIDLGF